MKNSFYFISFLTFIFSLVGCSKETENLQNETKQVDMSDKVAIENGTLENKIKYAEFHLLKIATFIAKDLKSNKITYEIFEKGQVNGKNGSILAEDLIKSISLHSRSNNSNVEITEIQKSLKAFEDLEDENWKPIISTIMFEKKLNRRGFDETEPIFILSTDTERENQVVDGYQLNESNAMEKISTPVTEVIATNNVVFKVAIVKAINVDGNGDSDGGSGGGPSGGNINDINPMPGGGTPFTPNYISGLKINKIQCLYKKESIFETNDVHFIGAKDNLDPLIDLPDIPQYFPSITNGWNWNGGVSNGTAQVDVEGRLIRHFTSTECDNQTQMIVNWAIDWGSSQSNGAVFYGIIFEHDNWPAQKSQVTFTFPNGQTKYIQYRSYENEYARPMLYNQTCYNNCTNPTPFPSTTDYWVNSDGWLIYNLFRG